MELVTGAAVVGEQEKAEPDLGDEQRLGEREQMRRDRPGAAAAPVAIPADQRRERAHGDRDAAEPGWTYHAPAYRARVDRPLTIAELGRCRTTRAAGVIAHRSTATRDRDGGRRCQSRKDQPAPDFSLVRRQGRDGLALGAARKAGRPLLLSQGRHAGLYGAGVRDPGRLGEFEQAGAVVLGVSPDGEESHAKFKEKFNLPFTLLSDPDHGSREGYGVWVEKTNYGKTYMGSSARPS